MGIIQATQNLRGPCRWGPYDKNLGFDVGLGLGHVERLHHAQQVPDGIHPPIMGYLLTGGPLECEANVLENDVGLRGGQRRLILIHQLSRHDEAGLLGLA